MDVPKSHGSGHGKHGAGGQSGQTKPITISDDSCSGVDPVCDIVIRKLILYWKRNDNEWTALTFSETRVVDLDPDPISLFSKVGSRLTQPGSATLGLTNDQEA